MQSFKNDTERKMVLKAGKISFHDISIGCFVLNISNGGAGLVVESDTAIPYQFELEIDGERVRRRCVVIWRNDRQLGVSFDFNPTKT
jgi:hypothetical protein